MNINKRDLVIFSIALLIGYFGYPLLNQQQTANIQAVRNLSSELFTEVDNSDLTLDKTNDVTVNKTSHVSNIALTKQDLSSESLQQSRDKTDQLNNQQSVIQTRDLAQSQEVVEDQSAESDLQFLQNELNSWTTEHKQKLRENLNDNLPDSIREGMLEQI